MRLVFAGTAPFAERALARLLDAGHDVPLVLTQPDRPAGRGLQPTPSAVKRLAVERGLPVFQPVNLKAAQDLERIAAANADAMVVAAYGLILPPSALEAGRRGAFNIHASLLPRWRGAAPIQRALLAGDRESGVSIMQMDAGLDTGPVLSRHPVPITADDDAGTLHDKLAAVGAEAIVAALADVEAGRARPVPQPASGVTYAAKVEKAEARLDWKQAASALERAIRAFRPAPGAYGLLEGEPVKIWRARVAAGAGEPGSVLQTGDEILIACGEDALAVSELQRAGGRRLSASQFLRGHRLSPGARFS
ncbi:MAG TPA: methionyl-tRNA formyltransferase [Burkholderiales bacterium]|nr:methionyl-tRNA formyltransferase [Burkholderiales bacterium]